VVVVGAGLSGLAAAFDLARGGADVLVLEAGDRAGGVVGTLERDGFRFETGPSTVPATSGAFRRLCGDLEIADRLIASSAAAQERYLFVRGRLLALPVSPPAFLLSPVLSVGGRLRVAAEVLRRWKPPPPGAAEPTMAEFVAERLGPEAARVLAGSFVRGVYAAELGELGARSAFPRMWRACEEHGGLIRGLFAAGRRPLPELPGPSVAKNALLSFPKGFEELAAALRKALGERLRLRCAVEALERGSGGGDGTRWRVRTAGGGSHAADHVVLAVPAPAAAGLLAPLARSSVPVESLRGIAHADLTLVHLGIERAAVPDLPPGFGYLVPPPRADGARAGSEARPRALGTLFPSNVFPGRAPEGWVAVSSFYASREIEGRDERSCVELACEDLARALRQARPPAPRVSEVRRWRGVIPRYAPGHADRIAGLRAALASELPGLHLAGSCVDGVSVDNVIAGGRAVAREILG
jgi:oxygen-dependent protoporphyrinogen oxidase